MILYQIPYFHPSGSVESALKETERNIVIIVIIFLKRICLLLFTALEKCTPEELLSFLSISGIPIENTNKILQQLDSVASNKSEMILKIIKEKG